MNKKEFFKPDETESYQHHVETFLMKEPIQFHKFKLVDIESENKVRWAEFTFPYFNGSYQKMYVSKDWNRMTIQLMN